MSLLIAAFSTAGVCSAAQTAPPAADRNVYLIDPLWVDCFDHWRPVGRAIFGLRRWNSFEPNPLLDWWCRRAAGCLPMSADT
jgi:hypothetical protein